jgi:hypothetical protein
LWNSIASMIGSRPRAREACALCAARNLNSMRQIDEEHGDDDGGAGGGYSGKGSCGD